LKAIVHIGTEKTGTTSIQKFLYQNRRKLKGAGFHFLQCAGKTNNRALPACFVSDERFDDFYRNEGIVTQEEKDAFKRKFLQKFQKEVKTLPSGVHTVIISSEHFHSRIRTEEEMDNLHKFLAAYFDDIRIVCYLRDQVSTCTSYYSTAMKSGNSSSFPEFLQRCKPDNYYFNYLVMLENWERCFGLDALDVSLYSRELFLNNSLLDDFTAKIDARLVGTLDTRVQIENESLTPAGQALARGVNLAFPIRTAPPEAHAIREKCKKDIYERFRGPGRQPSLATQRKIFDGFCEVNEALRKKFFPHMEYIFSLPASEPAPVTGIDDTFIQGLSSVLSIIRNSRKLVVSPAEYAEMCGKIMSSVAGIFQVEEEDRKQGKEAIISKDELRLLMIVAKKMETRDLALAGALLTLVQGIDPSMQNINAKLEEYSRRKERASLSLYIITLVGGADSLNKDQIAQHVERLQLWIDSIADSIEGSTVNMLKDNREVLSDEAESNRKPVKPTGFTLIRAESIDAAYAIAQRCPHRDIGGKVYVAEILQAQPNA
jgi:hypothetical protein